MAALWTTDGLLARVKRRAQIPAANGKLTDQEILDIAYEEILAHIVPELKATRENYLVASTDIAITSGTAEYRIPERAQGDVLRDVALVKDGQEWELDQVHITSIQEDRISRGYVIVGSLLTLVPAPTASGYALRLRYYRRFPKLVPASEAPQITGIAGAVVTASAGIPAGWSSSSELDIVQGRPGFDLMGSDLGVTSVSTPDVTLDAAPSSEVQVGDYIALAGESPVIQLPDTTHSLAYSLTASQVLTEVGDREGAAIEWRKAQAMLGKAVSHQDPRTDAKPGRIVNRSGVLRRGRRRRWGVG